MLSAYEGVHMSVVLRVVAGNMHTIEQTQHLGVLWRYQPLEPGLSIGL